MESEVIKILRRKLCISRNGNLLLYQKYLTNDELEILFKYFGETKDERRKKISESRV